MFLPSSTLSSLIFVKKDPFFFFFFLFWEEEQSVYIRKSWDIYMDKQPIHRYITKSYRLLLNISQSHLHNCGHIVLKYPSTRQPSVTKGKWESFTASNQPSQKRTPQNAPPYISMPRPVEKKSTVRGRQPQRGIKSRPSKWGGTKWKGGREGVIFIKACEDI